MQEFICLVLKLEVPLEVDKTKIKLAMQHVYSPPNLFFKAQKPNPVVFGKYISEMYFLKANMAKVSPFVSSG